MARKKPSPVHGVVVVDKAPNMTSHDVVAKARKAIGTRRIGHAGTLDPMATGVMVLAVGEGTKLVPYLTADDKEYSAVLRLGVATDSLDADGEVVGEADVPALTVAKVQQAADAFLGPHKQQAPAVSAIKVDGERLHAKARRGEVVEAPFRDVCLHSIEVTGVDGADIAFSLKAAKGFYVRSFGRDLAAALGTLGHLTMLRRSASGAFALNDAVDIADPEFATKLLPMHEAAARVMPTVAIDGDAARDIWHGRTIGCEGLGEIGEGPVALVDGQVLRAVAQRDGERMQVLRGIRIPGTDPV